MKKIIVFLALLSLLLGDDSKIDILKDIKSSLKAYTFLATKTKENEHYQPYIISVLNQKELKELGITTLEEALRLIPNIDIASDNLYYKTAIFRGSNPTSYGQSKLFIDNILVNNISFDGYGEFMSMPIDIIKRIEVIRGPGNTNCNDTASYAGSIRVITYSEDMDKDSVFTRFGSYKDREVGFTKSYKGNNLKIFTDFFYKRDEKTVHVNSDGLASGILSYVTPWYVIDNRHLSSPADIPLYLKEFSLGTKIKYKNFTFLGRIYNHTQGSAFAYNYIPSKGYNYLKLPNHYIQLSYDKDFIDYEVLVKFGENINSMATYGKLAPNGMELPKLRDITQKITFPNGIYSTLKNDQFLIYHSSSIKIKNIKNHLIKLSYYISNAKTTKIYSTLTNRDTGVGIVDYTNTFPFFDKNAKRKTYILKASDILKYNKNLSISYGLNYENNSHIKSVLEPNFSLVFDRKDSNIYKFLFSSSHRTPSWQEIYVLHNKARVGNKNLKAEKIKTFELTHIKNFSLNNFIQTTIFYIINKNQIHNYTPNNQYINSDKTNNLYGLEFEYKGNITSKDSVYFNFSYTTGKNEDKRLVLVSPILFKGYYKYNIKENLSLSSILKYSSKKKRTINDNRSSLPSTTILDISLNYKNYLKKYNINFSIKNLFNKKVIYPSKPNTYKDDYPEIGRRFMITFSRDLK